MLKSAEWNVGVGWNWHAVSDLRRRICVHSEHARSLGATGGEADQLQQRPLGSIFCSTVTVFLLSTERLSLQQPLSSAEVPCGTDFHRSSMGKKGDYRAEDSGRDGETTMEKSIEPMENSMKSMEHR